MAMNHNLGDLLRLYIKHGTVGVEQFTARIRGQTFPERVASYVQMMNVARELLDSRDYSDGRSAAIALSMINLLQEMSLPANVVVPPNQAIQRAQDNLSLHIDALLDTARIDLKNLNIRRFASHFVCFAGSILICILILHFGEGQVKALAPNFMPSLFLASSSVVEYALKQKIDELYHTLESAQWMDKILQLARAVLGVIVGNQP